MPACVRPVGYVPRHTHECDASVLLRRHLADSRKRCEERAGQLPEVVKGGTRGLRARLRAERASGWGTPSARAAELEAAARTANFGEGAQLGDAEARVGRRLAEDDAGLPRTIAPRSPGRRACARRRRGRGSR